MSAPDMAKRLRNASGICARKSCIDGCPLMLGHSATYIATRSRTPRHHAGYERRWS
jgi:hypothetical protein